MVLSTLFYVNAEMVKIASTQWGIDPYYINRKIIHSSLEEINITKKQKNPLRQVMERTYETWQNSQNSLKYSTEQHNQEPINVRAIYKDRQELHKIIKPKCKPYEEKPYSREEARQINEENYEELRIRADKAVSHPAQAKIARATSITQLRPDQLNDYVEYGKNRSSNE